jgi:hypothetical protein
MAHSSTSPTILRKYHDATQNDKKRVRFVTRFCNAAAAAPQGWRFAMAPEKQTAKAILKANDNLLCNRLTCHFFQ